MNKIIRTELYKLRHNLGFIILLLVSVALYGGMNYMTETSADAVSAFTQMGSFSSFIPVFAAVATASIVCDDYQLKTMKNIISSGVSKNSIFFGKYITSMLATLLLLVLDAVVTIAVCGYFKGFSSNGVVMQQLLINIALQMVVVLIFNTISFVIASLLKSSKSTIILSALLYFLDGGIFVGIASLTKIKMIDNISLSIVETDIDNFVMTSNDYLVLAGHLVFAVLLLLLACMKFKKSEVK